MVFLNPAPPLMTTPSPASICSALTALGRQAWWWWGLLVVVGLGALPLRAEISREDQLKSAFLYNFTKFVEWPPERFADSSSPIVIGVVGQSPVRDELEMIVRGRLVNGRGVVVHSITSVEDARAMHLVFVPAGEEGRFAGMTGALRMLPVVTVGESGRFAALGGMIVFTRDGDKMRFAINLESSEQARLRLSAQLLKLASAVRRSS